VPVRYDPWDVSVAYALMGNLGWVRCRSEHWDLLRGHTERELQFAVAELRKLRADRHLRSTLGARQLAIFMHEVQKEEAFLLRDREAANREVINLAESGDLTYRDPLLPPTTFHRLVVPWRTGSKQPTSATWDCLDLAKLPKFKSF
jgi:hypothetical protein